jgi:hypothetical protein
VSKGFEDYIWISTLSFEDGISVTHITDFAALWTKIQDVHLKDEPDTITWKLTSSGPYSSSLAYLAQFDAPITSFMVPTV